MKAIIQFLFISILTVACSGCGNGGSDISVDPPPPLPGQPQVTVKGESKQLVFSWAAVPGANHYRLMENPDGHSGFTQVDDNIPAGTLTANRDIAVHLFDWVNAQYIVEACNVTGCSSSDVATPTDVMLDTIAYIKASNTEAFDRFGWAVALSADGNTLAVGASEEDSSAIGINGDQADNLAEGAGAVYLFRFDGKSWAQQAYIKPSNTRAGDRFGKAVALSADGNTLAVGAPWENSLQIPEDPVAEGAGAVYIFRMQNSTWTEQAMLKPAYYGGGPLFGATVSLSADGNRLAIGAPKDDMCARGANGEIQPGICVESGAAYVFDFDGTLWQQQAYIKGGWPWDYALFGREVFLNDNGSRLVVNAPGEIRLEYAPYVLGTGYTFRFDGSDWISDGLLAPDTGDNLVFALTGVSGDGTTITAYMSWELTSARCSPQCEPAIWTSVAQVWRKDAQEWVEVYQLLSPLGDYNYGNAVLSADGNIIVAVRGDDSNAIGIDGDRQNNLAEGSGAVDVFQFDGVTWEHNSYVKASNTGAGDVFGGSMVLSADGNTLAIGALFEDSSATGINGDQADNSATDAGAVYVY
jgi:hypothetical protein